MLSSPWDTRLASTFVTAFTAGSAPCQHGLALASGDAIRGAEAMEFAHALLDECDGSAQMAQTALLAERSKGDEEHRRDHDRYDFVTAFSECW